VERRLVTAAGDVTLRRGHFTCRRCDANTHPLDDRLGVDGLVSPHAQRLLCLAGVGKSFDEAARHLRELAGLTVCDNTVRKVCDRHGAKSRVWQREEPEAARAFTAASGDVEFQTDGTCVNTTKGWREIRLSVFAKRERGRPVNDLDDWDEQRLPAPTVRIATAAIRTSEALGPQWRRSAGRLGIKQADRITVLADGAKWIWNQVAKSLPGATGVLDFYHAGEHIYAAARNLHGEGTVAAKAWAQRQKRTLLESGADGLLAALRDDGSAASDLIAYLEPHRLHTRYRERLGEGRSIGSGMVEGGCKTVIGKRLKQTGARWKHRRVEHMASLCCLGYGDQWDAYWKKATG
jgi:hypothetical protein